MSLSCPRCKSEWIQGHEHVGNGRIALECAECHLEFFLRDEDLEITETGIKLKMIYDDDMDKECVPLCDAINAIPGLETSESCSGHGKAPFSIFLRTRSLRNLYVLFRVLDRRYVGKLYEVWAWRCEGTISDMEDDPVHFHVTSHSHIGELAYEQSNVIADNILEFLRNDKWMKMFGINSNV